MQHSATTSGAFISRLRRGWIFLERTRVLSGIQFTRHFIEFVVVETKELVCSNINVILTRQTCDQHSGISICKSNRRALACCISERFCYMFLISKYRESDLGLRTISGLAKRMPLRGGDFRLKRVLAVKFAGSRHCAAAIFLQVPTLDRTVTFLYILILNTHTKFAREKQLLALGVCFPQPCLSAGRRFAASRSRLHYYRFFFHFNINEFDKIPCKLDYIENPRPFEKYPTPP